mgnify:CR=1 FL=1
MTGMRLLPRRQAPKPKALCRHGLYDTLMGLVVLPAYAAGIVWMFLNIPVVIGAMNVLLFAFFGWWWAKKSWRILWGQRFLLGVTSRSMLLSPHLVEKNVDDEHDVLLEIPAVDVVKTEWVDRRDQTQERDEGTLRTVTRQTDLLRIHLKRPLPEAVDDMLGKVRGKGGFVGSHVHIKDECTVELLFKPSQAKRVLKVIGALDSRLLPPERRREEGGQAVPHTNEAKRLQAMGVADIDSVPVDERWRQRQHTPPGNKTD